MTDELEEDPFAGLDDQPGSDAVAPPGAQDEDLEPAGQLFYGSVDEFVRKHLRFQYRRVVARPGRGEFRWKAAWWQSEEAVSRLEAVWRMWEAARQAPAAVSSIWWLSHCDRHMQVLLSPSGPFANSTDENKPGEPLPCTPAPDRWFAPDRQP